MYLRQQRRRKAKSEGVGLIATPSIKEVEEFLLTFPKICYV